VHKTDVFNPFVMSALQNGYLKSINCNIYLPNKVINKSQYFQIRFIHNLCLIILQQLLKIDHPIHLLPRIPIKQMKR
jgi:hypothetical protein